VRQQQAQLLVQHPQRAQAQEQRQLLAPVS
jgi:hypothetical protein